MDRGPGADPRDDRRSSSHTPTASPGTPRSTRSPTSKRSAWPPRTVNVKPSRFGSIERLFAAYDYCEAHGIGAYGGGQWELGDRTRPHPAAGRAVPSGHAERRRPGRLQRDGAAYRAADEPSRRDPARRPASSPSSTVGCIAAPRSGNVAASPTRRETMRTPLARRAPRRRRRGGGDGTRRRGGPCSRRAGAAALGPRRGRAPDTRSTSGRAAAHRRRRRGPRRADVRLPPEAGRVRRARCSRRPTASAAAAGRSAARSPTARSPSTAAS